MVTYSHAELEELLGVYALDAVEPEEAAAIELHLRDCPRCRAEVEAHCQTAALLAHTGHDAPAGLWDRIAGTLDETPPTIDRPVPWGRPRRRWTYRVLAGATAVAAAAVVVLGLTVVRQNHRLDRLSLNQDVTAALVDPAAQKVRLVSTDRSKVADAVVLPDGRGYIVSETLPRLTGDRTYQLWAVTGDTQVSLGVLGPNPGVVAFRARSVPPVLAITAEQGRHGVAKPQHPPVVTGVVRTA
jgi:anti-sigma-K factor RskA